MKTKYLSSALILIFVLSMSVSAQKEAKAMKTPKSVTDAFAKLYPKATDVKWEKEGDEEFEANFKDNGTEISVVMDDDGKLQETETVISISDLPKSVAPYIEKKYAGYTVIGAAKIVNAKGTVTYEAEIKKEEIKKEVIFNQNGKPVVKKHLKKEEDEKEEHEKN